MLHPRNMLHLHHTRRLLHLRHNRLVDVAARLLVVSTPQARVVATSLLVAEKLLMLNEKHY